MNTSQSNSVDYRNKYNIKKKNNKRNTNELKYNENKII